MKMELNKEELEFTIKILKEKKESIQFVLGFEILKGFIQEKEKDLQKNLDLCDSIILKLQEESESWLDEKN